MQPEEQIDLVGNPADLDRLRVTFLRLARRIRASADETLTATQRSVLGTIFHLEPVSISEIAEREHVRVPSASRTVAGLEQAGLVARQVDPTDRRTSLISLTDQGRARFQAMRAAGLGFLAGRLRKLDDADVAILNASLPTLERLLGRFDDDSHPHHARDVVGVGA